MSHAPLRSCTEHLIAHQGVASGGEHLILHQAHLNAHEDVACATEPQKESHAYCQLSPRGNDNVDELKTGQTLRAWAMPPWRKLLMILALITIWWVSAVVMIMKIKWTTEQGAIFPYAFAFASLVQPTSGFMAWLMSRILQHHRHPLPPFKWAEVAKLVTLGVIQGVEIALTNKSLQYLPVATRTMINSTSVFFMMATAWFWGLERLGFLRLVAASLLFLGGVLQTVDNGYSPSATHKLGIAMQFGSILASSQRWALVQFVLQRSPCGSALGRMSKLQLLSRTMPITGIDCIVLSIMFENNAFRSPQLFSTELLGATFAVATGLVIMLASELMLVRLLSAVAFQVLSTIHQIPIIIAGVILEGNRVGDVSLCGFGVCIAGALVYAAARNADLEETKDQLPIVEKVAPR